MTLDHIGIALFDHGRELFKRISFRFLNVLWIDNQQFLPARIVGERDAHDVIARSCVRDAGDRVDE